MTCALPGVPALSTSKRLRLVNLALIWQETYGVAPAITSTISEYDVAKLVGMSESEYSDYMRDKTAVARGLKETSHL